MATPTRLHPLGGLGRVWLELEDNSIVRRGANPLVPSGHVSLVCGGKERGEREKGGREGEKGGREGGREGREGGREGREGGRERRE